MEFTEEKKNKIEKLIVDKSILALEQGFIKEEGLGDISLFVLSKIDEIQTQDELMQFLRELSNKWHFFSEILVIESGETQMQKEHNAVEKVEHLAEDGNIDEAIKVAKMAMEAPQQ